jgi:alpha-tubulin suppressor-like RCC1 family protein
VTVDLSPLGDEHGFVRLASGDEHVCGMTARGRVYCWGQNQDGQLGTGSAGGTESSPAPVDTSDVSGEKIFVGLAAGKRHSCASTTEGRVYCWGSDAGGRLGNGDGLGDTPVPVRVAWMDE